jgi:hypothetical protein
MRNNATDSEIEQDFTNVIYSAVIVDSNDHLYASGVGFTHLVTAQAHASERWVDMGRLGDVTGLRVVVIETTMHKTVRVVETTQS